MQQNTGSFHVPEKPETEPMPFAGARNQSGNVGQHESLAESPPRVADRDDAEMGLECRERVVGDLRACATDGPDQSALTDAGSAGDTGLSRIASYSLSLT